MAAYQSIRNMN